MTIQRLPILSLLLSCHLAWAEPPCKGIGPGDSFIKPAVSAGFAGASPGGTADANGGTKSPPSEPPQSAPQRTQVDTIKKDLETVKHDAGAKWTEAKDTITNAERLPTDKGDPNPDLLDKAAKIAQRAQTMDLEGRELAKDGLKSFDLLQKTSSMGAGMTPDDYAARNEMQDYLEGRNAVADQVANLLAKYGYRLPKAHLVSTEDNGAPQPEHAITISNASENAREQFQAGPSVPSIAPPVKVAMREPLSEAQQYKDPMHAMTMEVDPVAAAKLKKDVDKNRELVLKQMGRKPQSVRPEESGPIRVANDDIFVAIHNRYQSLRDIGRFYEASLPLAPVTQPKLEAILNQNRLESNQDLVRRQIGPKPASVLGQTK